MRVYATIVRIKFILWKFCMLCVYEDCMLIQFMNTILWAHLLCLCRCIQPPNLRVLPPARWRALAASAVPLLTTLAFLDTHLEGRSGSGQSVCHTLVRMTRQQRLYPKKQVSLGRQWPMRDRSPRTEFFPSALQQAFLEFSGSLESLCDFLQGHSPCLQTEPWAAGASPPSLPQSHLT